MTVQAKTETVAEPKEIMANPLVASVVANCLMAAPASAGGALFDFNLTLPIMVGQFVLLVFFLDNVYFKRVAKILAERDELIRNKLASAGDDNSELLRIEEEIESGLAGARSKASGHIASVREASQGKADAEIAAHKAALEKELDSQLATLAAEKEATMKSVEGQVSGLAKDIISKVLPAGVSI